MSRQQRNAELRMEEELNTYAIVNHSQQSRPRNTIAAFEPKQKEFVDWAESKGYENPSTVTEAKVALFLNTVVVNRENKRNAAKKIGKSTVERYISALTALSKYQVSTGTNNNPTPRGLSVKSIRETLARNTFQERRQCHYDRGLLYQHLLTNEMQAQRRMVAEYFWNNSQLSSQSPFASLRNRAGYLLSEQGLLRGENIREAEFPDFFTVEIEGEGPTRCVALGLVKGRGKSNQFGKPLFSGYYRHSDVRLCAVSAVALYLFYRFHIAGEPSPNFSQSQYWYNTVFLCADVNTRERALTYSSHADAIRKAHEKLHIQSHKLTHGGRYYGKQKLDREGVEKISANIAGGWSVGAGDGCYGNGLDRPSIRAMAGFPPHERGAYFLPRACLEPPSHLSMQVFPWLEDWERRHKEQDRCEPNIAVDGFLRMIRYFREVILQDASVMIGLYPHPIWNHEIFKSTDFTSYTDQLAEAIKTNSNPLTSDIERLMPELCRQIYARDQELNANVVSIVKTSADNICNKMDTTHSNTMAAVSHMREMFTHILRDTADKVDEVGKSSLENESRDIAIGSTEPADHSSNDQTQNEPPMFEYVVSEAVSSVPDVLMEWEVGFNGRPSISSVEAAWKNKWRLGTKRQKIFSRRCQIIKMIKNTAERKRIQKQEAAMLIEEKRKEKKMSLINLADHWKTFDIT